jgi:hypothetical protein
MTNHAPDIDIYIKKLKEFFSNNEVVCQKVFGGYPLDECLKLCHKIAIDNYKQLGVPELTKEQFIEVRNTMEGKAGETIQATGIFWEVPGFLPSCLN